jgi:hypothetical protein
MSATARRADRSMPNRLDPRLDVLPPAQRQLWSQLAAAPRLSFVLYGGTAIALHLGHRQSEDFDFFRHEPLDHDREELKQAFPFVTDANVVQDELETFVVSTITPLGPVKVSFFGGLRFGRIKPPLLTTDKSLLVASLDDLLATKLKAILGRAEAKDYVDIAALLRAGILLPQGLAAFRAMFGGEPTTVLRAIGYFDDGDVRSLAEADRNLLRHARDSVAELPDVEVRKGSLSR